MSKRTCFVVLAVTTLLVRFPFFFPETDLDESTFILMGQNILKGHLPYTNLWDLKPPLLYGFFALLLLIAKSIPLIRLAGSFCVAGAAWFVFLMGEKIRNRLTGLLAALLLIVFATLTGDGSTTSSEIIAILPLSAAAFLCLGEDLGKADFFLVGLFISIACMFRLNLAYVALLGCVFLAHPRFVNTSVSMLARLAVYAMGGAIPVVLTVIPYLAAGKVLLLYDTCVRAALAYSNSQGTPAHDLFMYLSRFGDFSYLLRNSIMLLSFCGGVLLIGFHWKDFPRPKQKMLATLAFFMVAVGVSILKSGAAYEQYLIQLLPFTTPIAAFSLEWLTGTPRARLFFLVVAASLAVPAGLVIDAYRPVFAGVKACEPLSNGPGYSIAAYLRKADPDNKPVFMMEEPIVYWLNGGEPLSRISIHPYNIGRPYLLRVLEGPAATSKAELVKVFSKKPEFVVKPLVVRYLRGRPDAEMFLSAALANDYILVRTIEDFEIYKRFSNVEK